MGRRHEQTFLPPQHLSEWLKLRKETTNVGEDVEKGEPSCTVGGNVNCCSHFGKQCGSSSELKIKLLYHPAIELLGIYPKDTDVVKCWDTCIPMFIAAMSTTDEWIKKMWSNI